MSTSAILCRKCQTRIATVTKGGVVRTLGGVIVRLHAHDAELTCVCGEPRKIRYPLKKAA